MAIEVWGEREWRVGQRKKQEQDWTVCWMLANDEVARKERKHVPHHPFAQRQNSNLLLVPRYIIESQSM
jgi:hypothetical protein